ncbi:MAG: hypothetical protein FWC72_06760, partial [Oscillospiraceae bacterium]|nr:hypothetical protein [Oscillospiraceae bacterium]
MKNSRIILIRRKHVAALLLTLAVAAIFYLVSRPGLTAEARAIPIYSVQREDRAVSLTFNVEITDDDHTKQVMQT